MANDIHCSDCPVCMSSPVFGVQLKCKHVLCYLCVKGVLNSEANKCPFCRKKIHKNVLKRPKFVRNINTSDRPLDVFNTYQWFYEGKRGTGYWAYDHSNGQLLEEAYSADQKMCEIVVSGVEYCIDFVRQIQYRKDRPLRTRKVRRDLLSNIGTVKGISGVSKYFVEDLFGVADLNRSHSSRSGQQNVNHLDSNAENEEQISKRIKVEVKAEPDSTTDD